MADVIFLCEHCHIYRYLQLELNICFVRRITMQLPFWRNYWQKPENIDIRHNIMPTGKRGLYISVNKEKKCPFYWKAKGCHHKKNECAVQDVKQEKEKTRKTKKWIDYIDIKGLFEVKYLQKITECLSWKEPFQKKTQPR